MKTIELSYTIEESKSSYRYKDGIVIKSNLADDELVECRLAKSLVDTLKLEAAVLEPDRLVLAIAEAQKREIKTSIEALDDMTLEAKIHSDKAYEHLSTIALEAETKYEEIEKKFASTEKRFNEKMSSTAANIKKDLEKLTAIEEKLTKINNWSLEKLAESINQLIKLAETDPELVKLVLEYKKPKSI